MSLDDSDQITVKHEDLDKCKKVLDSLIAASQKDGIQEAETTFKEWRHNVQSLKTKLDDPPSTKITIFGNTGEGKSSLLNALYDEPDLLPHHGMGDACTSVITRIETVAKPKLETEIKTEDEEMNPTGGEDEGFQADIIFFTKEEWESEIALLKRDWSEGSKDKIHDIAKARLSGIYGDFGSPEELDHKVETRTDITEKLSTTKTTKVHPTAEDLHIEIKDYIGVTPKEFQWWPIVKSVEIRLFNPKVNYDGLVFTDLPGKADSNPVRVAVADKEKELTDVLMVVARIDRCKANTTLQDNRTSMKMIADRQMIRQAEMDQQETWIVCTRTDESIDVKGAMEWMGPEDLDKAKTLDKQINECKRKTAEHGRTKKQTSGTSPYSEQRKLKSTLDVLCANARNTRVKEDLRGSDGEGCTVLCVSSTDYMDLVSGDFPKVFQDQDETEIPKLRSRLQMKAAEQKRKKLESIQRQFQSVVSDTHSYLLNIDFGEKGQSKEQVSKELRDMKTELMDISKSFGEAVDRKYNAQLLRSIKKGIVEAEDSAMYRSRSWSTDMKREVTQGGEIPIEVTNLPCNTFRATVSRGGAFLRTDGALVDFNADLADPLIEMIYQPWLDVFGMKTWTELVAKEAIEAARITIQRYATRIQDVLEHSHTKLMKDNLCKIRDDAILKLEAFRNIVENMVIPEQRRAHRVIKDTTKTMMSQTYAKCDSEVGPGSYDRMKNIMDTDLQQLKDTIFKSAGAKLEEKIDSLKTNVCEHILATLTNIHKEYKLQIDGLWIKQEGQQFSDSEVLVRAKTDLLLLLADKEESGQSVKSEGRKRKQPGYSHQPIKKRRKGTEGTLHLTFANPDDEREALRYYQENLPTFLRKHDIDVINIKQGSVAVLIVVFGDFTMETILIVITFLRQGPPTPPSDIQTTMQPLSGVCFNLNIQVGNNNTMNITPTSTDQQSDSQFSSSTSSQSNSPSQQASSISPQSSMTRQQASSTSAQSSMTSQQASLTSSNFITRGPGSDLGESSGAQASSEYTENCTEVATIRISCDTERTHHQIREVLDELKNRMESPQVAMETEENASERTLSLHIRRLNVANTLSMWMIIKTIVNFRSLHEHLVSRTAMGGATYTITIPPETP